jgi:hypothetical protein
VVGSPRLEPRTQSGGRFIKKPLARVAMLLKPRGQCVLLGKQSSFLGLRLFECRAASHQRLLVANSMQKYLEIRMPCFVPLEECCSRGGIDIAAAVG